MTVQLGLGGEVAISSREGAPQRGKVVAPGAKNSLGGACESIAALPALSRGHAGPSLPGMILAAKFFAAPTPRGEPVEP